jgi:hypothetical protein
MNTHITLTFSEFLNKNYKGNPTCFISDLKILSQTAKQLNVNQSIKISHACDIVDFFTMVVEYSSFEHYLKLSHDKQAECTAAIMILADQVYPLKNIKYQILLDILVDSMAPPFVLNSFGDFIQNLNQ